MSVPVNSYDSKVLRDNTEGTDYQWAKILIEYGSTQQLFNKFYIDMMLVGTEDGIQYFIGAVLSNSINKNYHSSVRKGMVLGDYIILKDAGLNTYGIGGIDNVLSSSSTSKDDLYENFPPRITDTTIYYSFKSAYYLDSTIKGW